MIDRQVQANAPVVERGIRRLDADGIADWMVAALANYSGQPIEYIVPVAHGAAIVALRDQALAGMPLDYEQAIPDEILTDYRKLRDSFAQTGSPPLPDGLNLGAQLFWLERIEPATMRESVLLPWAQYWGWFLSGVAVSEVSSLGCHSDLWNPHEGGFSNLAQCRGWADHFAPLAAAGATIGTILPELAARTGLPGSARILAGLHDSNAALLAARGFAELNGEEATVLSTGTWFIAMRTPAGAVDGVTLPERRDCLVNVDVFGRPVPSARFMGGREIETIIGIDTRRVDIKPDQAALIEAVPALLDAQIMLLPTLAPGCGPFPDGTAQWLGEPDGWVPRRAAVCLYAALVADAMLDLIGSRENLLIEGRFAEAEVFVQALAALRPDCAVYTANSHHDVSFGALRLIDPELRPHGALKRIAPLHGALDMYRDVWLAALAARKQSRGEGE